MKETDLHEGIIVQRLLSGSITSDVTSGQTKCKTNAHESRIISCNGNIKSQTYQTDKQSPVFIYQSENGDKKSVGQTLIEKKDVETSITDPSSKRKRLLELTKDSKNKEVHQNDQVKHGQMHDDIIQSIDDILSTETFSSDDCSNDTASLASDEIESNSVSYENEMIIKTEGVVSVDPKDKSEHQKQFGQVNKQKRGKDKHLVSNQ